MLRPFAYVLLLNHGARELTRSLADRSPFVSSTYSLMSASMVKLLANLKVSLLMRPTELGRRNCCSAVQGRACLCSLAFLRAARCNRNLRRPRARSRSRRGICAGRGRPEPSPAQNTPPSKDVLPGAEWDSSRLRPSAPSGRHKPSPHSCCAGIRPRQLSRRPTIRAQLLPSAIAGNHLSPALAPGIACSMNDHPQIAAALLNLPSNQLKSRPARIRLPSFLISILSLLPFPGSGPVSIIRRLRNWVSNSRDADSTNRRRWRRWNRFRLCVASSYRGPFQIRTVPISKNCSCFIGALAKL